MQGQIEELNTQILDLKQNIIEEFNNQLSILTNYQNVLFLGNGVVNIEGNKIQVPVKIPLTTSILFDTNIQDGLELIQSVLLNHLKNNLKSNNLQLHLIDPNTVDFDFLGLLPRTLSRKFNNHTDFDKEISYLKSELERKNKLLVSTNANDIHEYNSFNKYQEKINIIVFSNFQELTDNQKNELLNFTKRSKEGFCILGICEMSTFKGKLNPNIVVISLENNQNLLIDNENEKVLINSFQSISTDRLELSKTVNFIKTEIEKTSIVENFLKIPIGMADGKDFYFELGEKADCFGALIGGRSRSGKTNLLHNIISQIPLYYSSDTIRLHLFDFKGNEFGKYRDHPNVESLLLGTDTSKALSMLKELRDIIDERSSKFDEVDASTLTSFNEKTNLNLYRIFIIIDEFQILFNSNRSVANAVLSDIARRGSAFGIYIILASQSLLDYALDQTLLNQLGLRVVLKIDRTECSKFLVMGNEVPANFEIVDNQARQALYNTGNGQPKFNQIIHLNFISNDEIKNFIKKYPFSSVHFEKSIIEIRNNENTSKVESEETKLNSFEQLKLNMKK